MFGKKKSPDEDPTSLANVLVDFGWVTKDQVDEALRDQGGQLIGQCMLAKGFITAEQLDVALLHQGSGRGTISDGEAGLRALEQKNGIQQKLIDSVKEMTESVTAAVTGSKKFEPIKRSK